MKGVSGFEKKTKEVWTTSKKEYRIWIKRVGRQYKSPLDRRYSVLFSLFKLIHEFEVGSTGTKTGEAARIN